MTQLNDKDHAAQMADMKSFDEEMPSIGFFCYNMQEHRLFDVIKKELTPRMIEDARAKGIEIIDYDRLHNIHNTQAFCGRVTWNIDKFIVLVGLWAEPIKDELSQLIDDTFHVPYFEFVYDAPDGFFKLGGFMADSSSSAEELLEEALKDKYGI